MKLASVLTIAGSDSSGGAGIQADLKTIAAHGLYGMSAITALTAQNTLGVTGITEADPSVVAAQIDACFTDIPPAAVKVGMVANADIIHSIASKLRGYGAVNVVVDPVMVATSGSALMAGGAVDTLVRELFPLADVVTPNIPEARALTGIRVTDVASMVEAARAIRSLMASGRGAVLVKGGHLESPRMSPDVLLPAGDAEPILIEAPRVATRGTHGTGCTLSSAIACGLARGMTVEEAVRAAKAYVTHCLAAGLDLGQGNGPLDHMAPWRAIAKPAGDEGAHDASATADNDAGKASVATTDKTTPRPAPVLVVAGSPQRPSPDLLARLAGRAHAVIACDSGADALMAAGIAPAHLVGDADSISPQALAWACAHAEDHRYPWQKDQTDLGIALDLAQATYPGHPLLLTGVMGGRQDHMLANLGLLARRAHTVGTITIAEDDATYHLAATTTGPVTVHLSDAPLTTFSLMAMDGCALVSVTGARWDLDHAMLEPLSDLGVSNLVDDPTGVDVTLHHGTLLIAVTGPSQH